MPLTTPPVITAPCASNIGRFHPEGHVVELYHVLSVVILIGFPTTPLQSQFTGKSEFTQVSQPIKINTSPATGAWVPDQLFIPGKCCQGKVLLVPALESDPVDFEI